MFRNRLVIEVTLVVCLTIATIGAPVVAANGAAGVSTEAAPPETADEFLSELRSYEEEPALETYSEMEVMRSQAVTAVQIGEFTEADRQQMNATVNVLATFVDAYGSATNGDRTAALDKTNQADAYVNQLDEAGGSQYATLARLGLERFYRHQGEELYNQSRNAGNTPDRLTYLEDAERAFEAGGAGQRHSQVAAEYERVRAEFDVDGDHLNSSFAAANEYETDCGVACDGPLAAAAGLGLGVFTEYSEARQAHRNALTAERLATEHGIEDRAAESAELGGNLSSALLSLALAGALFGLTYGAILGAVGMLLITRLATWAKDLDGSEVGHIVPQAPVEASDL